MEVDYDSVIRVDANVYQIDDVFKVFYIFSDEIFFYITKKADEYEVHFSLKEDSKDDETIGKRIHEQLNVQRIKSIVDGESGHIRDLIVARAFAPINKE